MLAACHRDKDAPPPTYSVGGTVSGLTGSVTLANNGGDTRTVNANGAFAFGTVLGSGAAYNVTVTTQPANQVCSVAGGSGTVGSSNISSITVTCAAITYTIGGSVSGLAGTGLMLQNNGGDNLVRTASGAFTFVTPLATGAAYAVTVATQPTNQRCTLANATGNVVAANVTNVAVTCETVRIMMDIGPTGGTLTGPDGVQIVVPPGALAAATTIGIERNGGAWPLPLPADFVPAGGLIYEFTPHDLVFDKPVLFRLPLPAGGAADPPAFVASFGQGWMAADAAINGNFVEWERPSLSWANVPGACAWQGPGPVPRFFCTASGGHSFVTATPPDAITMLSGVSDVNLGQNSAGRWAVNTTTLTTLHVTMRYRVRGDCGGATLELRRLLQPSGVRIIAQTSAPLGPLDGSHMSGSSRLDIPAQEFDGTGASSYVSFLDCVNRGGGGDWFTFVRSPSGSPGFTVGGQVSGLTTSGLELRNFPREGLAVPPNATSYVFLTPQADATLYRVAITQQPTGAICTVQNGLGTVSSANVVNASITCTPTTPPAPGPLILTANNSSNSVSIVRRAASSGTLTSLASVQVGPTPTAIALTSDGRFAYVANQGGGFVSAFSVNRANGTLTTIALSQLTTPTPTAIAVDPLNRFLFVANGNNRTVSAFTIDSTTGALTSVAGSPFTTLSGTTAVAVHPSGNFVYVLTSDRSLWMFSVNGTTGALTLIGTLANQTPGPGIVATPNGQFVYTANGALGSLTRLTVNPSTGALTVAGFTTTNNANSVVVHPNGNFLYVANNGSFNNSAISQFAITAGTGALTLVGSPLLLPTAPYNLAIDATGTFLYATILGSNSVASLSIESGTGTLTAAGSAATGTLPTGVVVTP